MRDQESGDWKVVDSTGYTNEAELQELLSESPSLIPINEIKGDEIALRVDIGG